MVYRPLLLISVLLALYLSQATAQKPNYEISNVRLGADHHNVMITYDLIAKHTVEPVKVNLFFHDTKFRFLRPITVTPDVNAEVTPGIDRRFAWDVSKDLKMLTAEISPLLIPGDPKDYRFGAGPEAALLSLAVPGLGNYFVTNTRNQVIKPYMKTITALGLITMGYIAGRDRYRDEPSLTHNDGIWKMGEWHYKYFKDDAEFMISLGLAIWVADVIYVAIKGHQNAQLKKGVMRLTAKSW